MNKPLTVARKEFIDSLVTLINESGLPAFVMSDVLKACLAEVNSLADRQLQSDLDAYTSETIKMESENNAEINVNEEESCQEQ